jgi:hypothetical protein
MNTIIQFPADRRLASRSGAAIAAGDLASSLQAIQDQRHRFFWPMPAPAQTTVEIMPSLLETPLQTLDGAPLTPLAARVRDHCLNDGSFGDMLRMIRDFEQGK